MFTAADTPSTSCPVLPLAREAIRLIRAMTAHEGRSPDLWSAAVARLDALEGCASALRATSQGGLFYQACIVFGAMGTVQSHVPEAARAEVAAQVEMAQAASISLARALTVPDLAPLADYYFPERVAHEVAA